MRRTRLLPLLLVAAFILAAPATAKAMVVTEVIAQVTVKPAKGEVRGLSSDGSWLFLTEAGDLGRDLCRYELATSAIQGCVAFPGSVVAGESVAFSPDGSKIVFTEEWRQLRDDTDIWLYDSVTGTVVNLTEDGVQSGTQEAAGAPADLAPAWSPDGASIAFVRSVLAADGSWSSVLMRLSVTGGAAEVWSTIGPFDRPVWGGLTWSADDSIRYAVGGTGLTDSDGVWEISACFGAPRQLVAAAELGLTHPVIVDGTDRGLLLITDAEPPGGYVMLDVATGAVTALSVGPDGGRMVGGGFSPDGGVLLVIRIAGQPTGTIFERDLETGLEAAIGDLEQPIGTHDLTAGLQWAANGYALVPGFGRAVSLVTLATPDTPLEPVPPTECAL